MNQNLYLVAASQKCMSCNGYLSKFPIYLSGNESLCGRCIQQTNAKDFIENKPFEELACHVKFPCIYDTLGCLELLYPADMENHEKICPQRSINCSIKACEWKGSYKIVPEHLHESHDVLFLKNNNEFEFDFLNTYSITNIIELNNEVFILNRVFTAETQLLECNIKHIVSIDYKKRFSYELVISNGQRDNDCRFTTESHHDRDSILDIDVVKLNESLVQPLVMIGKIVISEVIATDDDNYDPKVSKSDMLEELECPFCMNYIIPPIFQCNTGHSICGDCKNNLEKCPICEANINCTRNLSLERIAAKMHYTCKFSVYGCKYVSTPNKMNEHHCVCHFGPQTCPLDDYETCKWENSKEQMLPHVLEKHAENFLELDTVTLALNMEVSERICYIIAFHSRIFRLDYFFDMGNVKFSLQLVVSPEKCVNYYYDIEILSSNFDIINTKKILIRNVCSPLINKEDTYIEGNNYISITKEQIKSFVQGGELTFRIALFWNGAD